MAQRPANIRVPADHIFVNDRWRGTPLGQCLCQKHNGIYNKELGLVDFYPTDNVPVLYFSETDFDPQTFKQRLKSFYSLARSKGLVIADRNTKTLNNFTEVQKFATFSLNLSVIPVVGPQDMPELLKEISYMESRAPDNPLSGRPEEKDPASLQLGLLMLIPNVGRRTAQHLLQKMGYISAISQASEQELAAVVGSSCAKKIFNFYHEKYKSTIDSWL